MDIWEVIRKTSNRVTEVKSWFVKKEDAYEYLDRFYRKIDTCLWEDEDGYNIYEIKSIPLSNDLVISIYEQIWNNFKAELKIQSEYKGNTEEQDKIYQQVLGVMEWHENNFLKKKY